MSTAGRWRKTLDGSDPTACALATTRASLRVRFAAVTAARAAVYLAPEVRAGVRLAGRVELTLGLEVPVLIAVPRPASSQQVLVDTTTGLDGPASAWFPGGPLTAPLFPLFMPVLGARYDFY